MRTQILALGALCLLLITLSLVRFVWIATAAERTLILERGVASRGLLMTALTLRFTVGQRLPMDVFILICDRNGVLNRMYQVHGATVKKCAVSDLDASRSEALIERFELSYETMESCPIAAGVAGGLQGALGVDIF